MENLNFEKAFEALKQGFDVKLPEWAGFWRWSEESIKMHGKDGVVRDIRETTAVDYTLRHILRNDWMVIPKGEAPTNLDIQTFTFGEAIRNLKAGKLVSRKGWNGKGMFVMKQIPAEIGLDIIPKMQSVQQSAKDKLIERQTTLKYENQMLIIKSDGTADSWVPSSSDVFAEDWCLVE